MVDMEELKAQIGEEKVGLVEAAITNLNAALNPEAAAENTDRQVENTAIGAALENLDGLIEGMATDDGISMADAVALASAIGLRGTIGPNTQQNIQNSAQRIADRNLRKQAAAETAMEQAAVKEKEPEGASVIPDVLGAAALPIGRDMSVEGVKLAEPGTSRSTPGTRSRELAAKGTGGKDGGFGPAA